MDGGEQWQTRQKSSAKESVNCEHGCVRACVCALGARGVSLRPVSVDLPARAVGPYPLVRHNPGCGVEQTLALEISPATAQSPFPPVTPRHSPRRQLRLAIEHTITCTDSIAAAGASSRSGKGERGSAAQDRMRGKKQKHCSRCGVGCLHSPSLHPAGPTAGCRAGRPAAGTAAGGHRLEAGSNLDAVGRAGSDEATHTEKHQHTPVPAHTASRRCTRAGRSDMLLVVG